MQGSRSRSSTAREIPEVTAAIRAFGRSAFARALDLYVGSVDNWRWHGVPAERVPEVEVLLDIPRQKIRPDVFGDLPRERKKELLRLREASRRAAKERATA